MVNQLVAASVFIVHVLVSLMLSAIYDGPFTVDTINESIRIGFLVSENPADDRVSLEAVHAAQLAVDNVNNTGGISGSPVELIIKSSEGVWGSGSKKSVELIYDDEVNAIVGSLDGQNAHLVEMAIAKAQVLFMGTRATDPTLTNANVPWFFRVIPSDLQQAERMVRHIYQGEGLKQVAIVSSDSYDQSLAVRSFAGTIQNHGYPAPLQIQYEEKSFNFADVLQAVIAHDIEGVIYLGYPGHARQFISEMERAGMRIPVYSTLAILNTDDVKLRDYLSNNITHICTGFRDSVNQENFSSNFEAVYGYKPGIVASYSYDGLNILFDGFKNGAIKSEELRNHLMDMSDFKGVTGNISFLENGDIKDNTAICR